MSHFEKNIPVIYFELPFHVTEIHNSKIVRETRVLNSS